jgi:hypothetical protein
MGGDGKDGSKPTAYENRERMRNKEEDQYKRKTKFCMFHLQGVCQFGSSCAFAHSVEELQQPAPQQPDAVQRNYSNSSPKPFTAPRGEEEVRPPADAYYKKRLCMWHERGGNCRNGDQCRFAHGEEELRSSPTGGERGPERQQAKAPAKYGEEGQRPQRRNVKPSAGDDKIHQNFSSPVATVMHQGEPNSPVPGLKRHEPMFVQPLSSPKNPLLAGAGLPQLPPPPPPPGFAPRASSSPRRAWSRRPSTTTALISTWP